MDIPSRTPTFAELPRDRWPGSWFHDGAGRQNPKYVRPLCRVLKALYGHLEAGALWEKTFGGFLKQQG